MRGSGGSGGRFATVKGGLSITKEDDESDTKAGTSHEDENIAL